MEDPRGRRFWIFSDQIFRNDFVTKFFNHKKSTERPYERKRFPGQVSKLFQRQVNNLYLFQF